MMSAAIFFKIEGGAVTWTNEEGTEIASQSMVEYEPSTKTFTVGNTPGVELPATGGHGTAIYTVAGLMLITLAGVLMIGRKRKYNR